MSDRGQRSERVGIVVYPNTKEKWEQAAEDDPDADSLSQFVRVAVNRYLHDRSNGSNAEASEEIHEHLAELQTQQQSALQRLDGINGQLSDIRDAVVGSAVDSETKELAKDIFEMLPSEQDAQTDAVLSGEYDTNGVPAPEAGTVEWLSERLDAPRFQIQTALDHLQETTYAVQRTNDGQYYKEV